MIGRIVMFAALLLLNLVVGLPNSLDKHLTLIAEYKKHGFINNGRLEIPVARYCQPQALKTAAGKEFCMSLTKLARDAHRMESALFCSHRNCNAKYDPSIGLCQCSWGTVQEMEEEQAWPGKNCEAHITCYAPFEPHWYPVSDSCVCAHHTFYNGASVPVVFRPDQIKEELYGHTKEDVTSSSIDRSLRRLEDDINGLAATYKAAAMNLAQRGGDSSLPGLETLKRMHEMLTITKLKSIVQKREAETLVARQTPSGAVSLAPLPIYIPPPNTEVTQQLIQESLLLQPQKVAIISSVVPDFATGVITFLVQLDGPVSQTLSLNATDTLPCENIGVQPQPNLILVPKSVTNGTLETTVSTCLVIAVNMYSPQYITYWIQKDDGSVFSLLSDNKIHAIDQLDPSQSASVVIRVASANNDKKRDSVTDLNVSPSIRRQIFSIPCKNSCPLYHMDRIIGSDGYCGCMFKNADQVVDLNGRGVEAPTPYTATMTAAACAAMTCINNGGNPALFNPFTATCWCAAPSYVESNDNAYNGGM